jgi:uncharacterized protein (DUF302 family)
MFTCLVQHCTAAFLAFAIAVAAPSPSPVLAADTVPTVSSTSAGVVSIRSAHGVAETVRLLKADIAAKGIVFFSEIDHAALAAKAGVPAVRPSVLLVFGNPPLGTQFIAARPEAGLDWPVRMLVHQDAAGAVTVSWTDFAWIAQRHGIANLGPQFEMASKVAASIAAAAAK